MVHDIPEELLAKLLKVTDRYVRDVFKEYKLPNGNYKLIKCVQKHIEESRSDMGTYVNLKTLSDILGVTERTVRNLTEKKVLIKNDNDKYELKENIKNYLMDASEGAKKTKAQRKMIELKLKVYEDKYHEDEVVRYILSDMLVKFKGKLISTIRKIDNELENNKNKKRIDILEKHILGTLTELSKYDPPSNLEKLRKELE